MKQVMNYNKDNGLLNMIRKTDPMIKTVLSSGYLGRWVQYENGQQTQTYKGNTHPGEKGYNIITSQSSMWDKFKHTMSNLF